MKIGEKYCSVDLTHFPACPGSALGPHPNAGGAVVRYRRTSATSFQCGEVAAVL